MIRTIELILGALGGALVMFLLCAAMVLIGSFAEWQWVGFNWPVTRALTGVGFFAGLVLALDGEI